MGEISEITLKEYLLDCSSEELCERLKNLDATIMALHQDGYIIGDFDPNHINIKLYNGELIPVSASIKGELGRTSNRTSNSNSYNVGAEQRNIREMCAIGICAFNRFSEFDIRKGFRDNLTPEFDQYCNNGYIPEDMVEYYQDVLINRNIDYLNNFMQKKADQGRGYQMSKSTGIGRAFNNDREAAYVNVLIIPALMVLIYFVMLVILYFVDK